MIIKMIKMLIVLVLIALVVGMYYRYDLTKEAIAVTGNAVVDAGKKAVEAVKESDVLENVTERIKEEVVEKIVDKRNNASKENS